MNEAVARREKKPAPEALLLDAVALARRLSMSVRTVRRMDSSGRLPRPIRIGKAVRWALDSGPNSICAWVGAGCPDRLRFETLQQQKGVSDERV